MREHADDCRCFECGQGRMERFYQQQGAPKYRDEESKPPFNHTRGDGPYDPCQACLPLMSREQLVALVLDMRASASQEPAEKVRKRIAELERMHANYLIYQADRVSEKDHHASWDVAIDLMCTEYELAGLRFALSAFGF